MVGLLVLVQNIGVRVPIPQQFKQCLHTQKLKHLQIKKQNENRLTNAHNILRWARYS